MLKLASWNVNSLKVRLEQVLDWIEKNQIDILALQETKLVNENFPFSIFEEKGYHVVFSGQKTYNGVAIISRYPITEVITDIPNYIDPQRRVLIATIANIRIVNLYVPNGASIDSDKYVYKLGWLEKITEFIQKQLQIYDYLSVLGDFNIAPHDSDVFDIAEFQGQTLVSPLERHAFNQLLSLGLTDSFRLFSQEDNLFSWWDYRAAGFRRNRGLRIDLILLNNQLKKLCTASNIDLAPRRLERPSDHAPVWVELMDNLNAKNP